MNNNRYWSHRICISCRSWLQYYHGSSFQYRLCRSWLHQYRLCRSCLQSPVSVVRLWLHQSPVPSIYRSWLQYLPSRPVSPVSVDCLWLHWWLSLLVLCLQYQHLQCVSSICQSLVTPVSFPVASGSIGCCFWFHWLSLVAP